MLNNKRINEIAKEFNIGIEMIKLFLEKEGFDTSTKWTSMANITDEQVEIIKREFYTDKSIKEKSFIERQNRQKQRERLHDVTSVFS